MLRVLGEKPADRLEPADQALGIVQPVHADREAALAEAVTQQAGVGPAGRHDGLLREPLGVDADRIDDGLDRMAAEDEPSVGVRVDAEVFGDAVQESRAIGGGVEADNVAGAQAGQQFGGPGHGVEDRRRHERRVQEKADAVGDAQGAQFGGQGDQVVVMHPDRVVRPQQLQQ